MQLDEEGILYRYSSVCERATLYSSAYACMILSLLGEIPSIAPQRRSKWIEYFNSMQCDKDGLFYDPAVHNSLFNDGDWWGARHLALHMVSTYSVLGERPQYPFRFLDRYKDIDVLSEWLKGFCETDTNPLNEDIDNKIMNICCLLQYQRDWWGDGAAGDAVSFIQHTLIEKINNKTGLWGEGNIDDPATRSRMVQFAYHLFPIFFYDGILQFDIESILRIVLETQNPYGGFSPYSNSSACEDIDSIYILARLSPLTSRYRSAVLSALDRGERWISLNQTSDGGFVFRLNEGFTYGHRQMMAKKNQGEMFSTWFRLLCLAYSDAALGGNAFHIKHAIGLMS